MCKNLVVLNLGYFWNKVLTCLKVLKYCSSKVIERSKEDKDVDA